MTNGSSLQERSINTRNALKTAFIEHLKQKGYLDTSIAEVAEMANSSVGAFQNHFGTKKGALLQFWDDYCIQAAEEIGAIRGNFIRSSSFEKEEFLFQLSQATAALQEENTGLNQAMNVHFVKERSIHQKTVEVMENMVGTIFEVVSTKTDMHVSHGYR